MRYIPQVTVSGLLLVAFIVLKLVGVITWSWWWVLAPLWVPVTFAVVFVAIGLIIAVYGETMIKRDTRPGRGRRA